MLFHLYVSLIPQNEYLNDLNALKARIKALEDKNKPSVESILKQINDLAMKSEIDFDKYEALDLAQSLAHCTQDSNHKKASYYAAALQELRSRLAKPTMQFKAFFLTLFADSDYAKVLESNSKVEKSFREPSSMARPRTQRQSVCFKCGRPGHFANRCRVKPYSHPDHGPGARGGPKPLFP